MVCSFERLHEKSCLLHMRKQVTAQLISTFVFATEIVQSLFILNLECQASSHLLCLYNQFVSDLVGIPEDRSSHDVAPL